MKSKKQQVSEKTYAAGEVMSMLEQINDGIGIIGEQHGGIMSRLDGIDNRLDGIDNRLDGIDVRLDKMQGDIDIIKGDIVDIKYDLKDKVSYAEFEKMEKRMAKLEKLVFAKLA